MDKSIVIKDGDLLIIREVGNNKSNTYLIKLVDQGDGVFDIIGENFDSTKSPNKIKILHGRKALK